MKNISIHNFFLVKNENNSRKIFRELPIVVISIPNESSFEKKHTSSICQKTPLFQLSTSAKHKPPYYLNYNYMLKNENFHTLRDCFANIVYIYIYRIGLKAYLCLPYLLLPTLEYIRYIYKDRHLYSINTFPWRCFTSYYIISTDHMYSWILQSQLQM